MKYDPVMKQESIDIKNKKIFKHLETLCNDGHLLGGSIALFLYGIKLNRPFKDIDLIYADAVNKEHYPYFSYIDDSIREPQMSEGGDYTCFIRYKKINFEILKGETSQYCRIVYKGYTLKVQHISVILKKKKEYAGKGYRKHADDLLLISKFFEIEETSHPINADDLPF